MKKDYSKVENILTSKLNKMIEKTEKKEHSTIKDAHPKLIDAIEKSEGKPIVHLSKKKNGRHYYFRSFIPPYFVNETWFHHERLNDCINDYIDRGFIVQIEDRI